MALLKSICKAIALSLTLGLSLCKAEQISIDRFDYLNNNEAPVILDQYSAQDLLNIDITPNGKSIKKRAGYGTYKTLSGSQALHGGIHFFDSSGNDIQVWGSSTSLWGIVADATPVQLVSSATLNTTWDCADTQGFAYCANSSRNALIKTNGATITWNTSPLGTMVAVTPERLLVAGVAASPSTIFYSAASNFTNFTVGINPQDSSTEQIAAPGSRITNIDYACGRWLWWKDLSFGYVIGTDQTNLQIKIVSSNIGTQDNSDAVDPDGNVYFRGQDGHIYKYDCNSLTRLTTEITPAIQTSGSRTSNSYVQTSQADWQTGTIVQTGSLSTTISPTDVVPSSFGVTETTNADFAQGTLTNLSAINNSLYLSTTNVNDDGSGWSASGGGFDLQNPHTNCGTMTDKQGGSGGASTVCRVTLLCGGSGTNMVAELIDSADSSVLGSTNFAYAPGACSYTTRTITVGSTLARRRVRMRYRENNPACGNCNSPNFLLSGTDITFYTAGDDRSGVTFHDVFFDANLTATGFFDNGKSGITSGSYASKAYDKTYTQSYTSMAPSYTPGTNSFTPTFVLQDATSGTGPWTDVTTSTTTSLANVRQFVRYLSTFTATSVGGATTVDDMTITARSSGTYYSPVVNRPNLSAWDTFNVTSANNGGTHTFSLRSSTNSFTVLSSTPSWTAQSNGQVISISTGTYLQFKDDFGVTASSHNPTLSDFAINWFEGTASDKAYAIYYDLGIWWSLAYGAGQSTNNYIFRYDLNNSGWTLYNFGAGGFLLQNNALYFGTTGATGKIYKFGSGATSDDGTAINAYWQSKDFTGSDPFMENNYRQIDLYARRNVGQTLTVGYTLNSSTTSTTYSVPLSSATEATIRYKKLLPAGKIGATFNIKVSDTSTASSWEVLGLRFSFDPLPYRPTQ